MTDLRQFLVMLKLNLKTFDTRIKGSLVVVVGVACVVVLPLAALTAVDAARRVGLSELTAADPNHAIVLSGSGYEVKSTIPREWIPIIEDAPGIRQSIDGSPLIDAEVHARIPVLNLPNGEVDHAHLRGIGPYGLAMIPKLVVLSGRAPRPGTDEVMVGIGAKRAAQAKYGIDLRPGVRVHLKGSSWSVVGAFSTGHLADGILLVDAQRLAEVTRQLTYNAVIVRLNSPESLVQFRAHLTQKHALPLSVESLSELVKRKVDAVPRNPPALILAYILGALVAMGVVTSIAHLMHSAVASRSNEVAVLRAIGFGDMPIAASLVTEVTTLACLGAGMGATGVWLWLDGHLFFGRAGVFEGNVAPRIFFIGILWALTIAFLGALMPAIRAARTSVVEAMKT